MSLPLVNGDGDMTDSIAAQVAALPKTPTPELKQMWRELFVKEPPGFSRNYLISRLAYRIQAGLRRTQARDPGQARRAGRRARSQSLKAHRERAGRGTQLIREWRGVEHKVTVLADGFEWEGAGTRA